MNSDTPIAPHLTGQAAAEKRRVATLSIFAALFLTSFKLIIGFATNSLGILAEALHSALDLGATVITLWAVRMSGVPADDKHNYGHGKFENLSALAETLLLIATCFWIVWEAGSRLLGRHHAEVNASLFAFLVVIVSIAMDYWRSSALKRVAQKYNSQALEADALHFSTDIWSSSVVFVGLLGVYLAGPLEMPWLMNADAVAALGVAALVTWISIRLARSSIDELLDAVPQELQENVAKRIREVPGVESVRQVRIRRSGPETFADVVLSVNGGISLEESHEIADRAEDAVRAMFSQVDVVVHVEPVSAQKT